MSWAFQDRYFLIALPMAGDLSWPSLITSINRAACLRCGSGGLPLTIAGGPNVPWDAVLKAALVMWGPKGGHVRLVP